MADPTRKAVLRSTALAVYQGIIQDFEQSRSLAEEAKASINIPLAKTYLDSARLLAQQNEVVEAKKNVEEARTLLNEVSSPTMATPWKWRLHYLMGDIALFDNNPDAALDYYRQTRDESDDFPPAQAMISYLTNGADTGNAGAVPAGGDAGSGTAQGNGAGSVPVTEPASQPQPPVVSTVLVTPPSEAKVEAAALTSDLQRQPKAATVFKAGADKGVDAGETMLKLGSFLGAVATLFEITELTPIATAISLGGMLGKFAAENIP